jgi:glycosyltransferase involved in cell wall biosynthesis
LTSEKRRIALVGNANHTLIRFRADLIRDLVAAGHEVFAFAPGYTERDIRNVKEMGATPVGFDLERAGTNPIQELKLIRTFRTLFEQHQIDTLFSYFVKPVIYGSIAARQAGIKQIYSMLGGLGYLFTDGTDGFQLKRELLRCITVPLFRYALKQNQTVFFQNPDDRSEFIRRGLVNPEKTERIHGSGVNLDQFRSSDPVLDPVTFITTGRLLEEKGFREYASAAGIVKAVYPETRFLLLGGIDENPGTLSEQEVQGWVDKGWIEWPGRVDNVEEWLHRSSVFVLPSYREGTPRSTLEALAAGRAVITTDVPGCRETVQDGVNGWLVPPRNAEALAEKMMDFIKDPSQIRIMGKESREIAEKHYDVRKVNRVLMRKMGLLKM